MPTGEDEHSPHHEMGQSRGRGIVSARRSPTRKAVQTPVSSPHGNDTVTETFHNAGDAPNTTTVHWGNSGVPQNVKIWLFFWGSKWSETPPPNPSAQTLYSSFATILGSPYLTGLKQYYVPPYSVQIEAAYLAGGDPPDNFTDSDVQQFVVDTIEFHNIGFSTSVIYFVVMPPGVAPADKSHFGAHSAVYVPLVFQHDVHVAWIQFFASPSPVMTEIFSHELVEALTDPEGDSLQVNPPDPHDWHEIGDVCSSTALVNGISVQSYWSDEDKACIIPIDIPVRHRRVTCIHKGALAQTPEEERIRHLDPHLAISQVSGISLETNTPFVKTQKEAIAEIESGVNYFVIGDDGSRADVIVKMVFPPWEPWGVKCIATIPDDSTEDNLLSLPECL